MALASDRPTLGKWKWKFPQLAEISDSGRTCATLLLEYFRYWFYNVNRRWLIGSSWGRWNFATIEVKCSLSLRQGCIFCLTCSYPELTEDHVLTSAYVKIFRTITRNAVNKSVWRKKDCFWLPLNKHAMNIWLSSLRIRAHLSWRTGKHLHVLHVLRTYSTC